MPEFGGLWKHEGNPGVHTECKSLQSVEVAHYAEAEEEEERKKESFLFMPVACWGNSVTWIEDRSALYAQNPELSIYS